MVHNKRPARVTAEVISCPGRLGSVAYCALQVNVAGFESPYVLTLALPCIGYKALCEQADPAGVFSALARAVNGAGLMVDLTPVARQHRGPSPSAEAC
jgi:hypothetical protein